MTPIKINYTEIPTVPYVGYLWLSDKQQPITLDNEQLPTDINWTTQFIVEGHLYHSETKKSYSIKYVDGQHLIFCYTVIDTDTEIFDDKYVIAQRLKGVNQLNFRQYWERKKDALCENMDVLEPAALVFMGFIKIEENKQ